MKASGFYRAAEAALDFLIPPLAALFLLAAAYVLFSVPAATGQQPAKFHGLAAVPDPIPPDGIRREEMANDGQPRYLLNGNPVDERTAFHAVASSDLFDDDSKLPWVTLVGPKAERDRVRADFNAAPLSEIPCRLKGYDPGAAPVADFPAGLIHLQAANGRLLFTADAYHGPAWLAKGLKGALAGYDPAKDPGPGEPYPKPTPPKVPDAKPGRTSVTVPIWAMYAFAVAIVFLIFRGKK
jgi:hypothetical protein